ncbi:DinB family protein [Fulvivirga lutea]|uniref:DinB family protein n=1 Tax=Fulvivirga lutea TaxID=2810512 RepID=A0A974WIR6_9BACT|nr:DinB family protein [Fulvivirga lutea]QSE98659.1 DinB family protein [Fulvivirga lutea]
MDKKSIIDTLNKSHRQFEQYLSSLTKEEFEVCKNGKWSAGQDLDHILKSLEPLSKILSNKEYIITNFGKGNGVSNDYDVVISRYKSKLNEGATAFGQFIPEKISWNKKTYLLQLLRQLIENITESLQLYTEEELDKLLLPHPLLGTLTVREMLHFTNYHVIHHQDNIIRNLELK